MVEITHITPETPHLETLVAEMATSKWTDLEHSWTLDATKAFLADPDNIWLLAMVDGQVAGMLTGYQLLKYDARQKESLLYEIETKPEFRRQGIGQQLIKAFLEICQQAGSPEAWVLTDADNAPARALYRSLKPSDEEGDIVMYSYDLVKSSNQEGEKS